MYPHRIRLRGPWDCTPLDSAAGGPRRITLPGRPADLGLSSQRGRLLLQRRFGYPGRIDAGEHVWLTCAGLAGRAELHLNDQVLAQDATGTWEADVTALLRPRNRLDVVLTAADDAADLWDEVALEVRRDAYLHDVSARRAADGAVHVYGQVAGQAAEPLELYALAERRTVHYQTIRAGESFAFALPAAVGAGAVRVELISVSTLWYAVELALPETPASP
jgi:hypothetical protein